MSEPNAEAAMALRAHCNMVAAFSVLPEHLGSGVLHREGGFVAALTGSPAAMFNEVLADGEGATAAGLQAAIAQARRAGVSWMCKLRAGIDDHFAEDLLAAGCTETEPEPAMVRRRLTDLGPAGRAASVRRVSGPDGYEEFMSAMSAGLGAPDSAFRAILGPGLAEDERMGMFVAQLDDRLAGVSLCVLTPPMVGIYNVSVAEFARRRGLGWALTAAGLEYGMEHGCTEATLQASEMGHPVYKSNGFEDLYTYRQFTCAGRPPKTDG